jgi:hypothetical protein
MCGATQRGGGRRGWLLRLVWLPGTSLGEVIVLVRYQYGILLRAVPPCLIESVYCLCTSCLRLGVMLASLP